MSHWTAADIPSQTGKTAIVTGANSGIGWNTALELARAGAEVILTARDERKGEDAIRRIHQQLPKAQLRLELLDLASLRSIHAFATRLRNQPTLDLLIHNAGVMSIPRREITEDGFERQFGTNYLGPFALTLFLLPALQRSANPRVTIVSSGAANMGLKKINFDDLQWERSYGPWKAYCQSKLADLLFMTELSRRAAQSNIRLLVTAAHPGWGPHQPPDQRPRPRTAARPHHVQSPLTGLSRRRTPHPPRRHHTGRTSNLLRPGRPVRPQRSADLRSPAPTCTRHSRRRSPLETVGGTHRRLMAHPRSPFRGIEPIYSVAHSGDARRSHHVTLAYPHPAQRHPRPIHPHASP